MVVVESQERKEKKCHDGESNPSHPTSNTWRLTWSIFKDPVRIWPLSSYCEKTIRLLASPGPPWEQWHILNLFSWIYFRSLMNVPYVFNAPICKSPMNGLWLPSDESARLNPNRNHCSVTTIQQRHFHIIFQYILFIRDFQWNLAKRY